MATAEPVHTCFDGPRPIPIHREGQCSGPTHPLGLWLQDAFVADVDLSTAHFIIQDMRKCNASEFYAPQIELYDIFYECIFESWDADGSGVVRREAVRANIVLI
jgi:hypothetical protein